MTPHSLPQIHYLTARMSDLRVIQLALHNHGISSLGSMEGHVLPSIHAVLRTIAAVTGVPPPLPLSSEPFLQGGSELADHVRVSAVSLSAVCAFETTFSQPLAADRPAPGSAARPQLHLPHYGHAPVRGSSVS